MRKRFATWRSKPNPFPCDRALAALLAIAGVAAANAQSSGGPYTIDKSVIAAGGATLAGGAYSLSGTVGQHATTHLAASGFSLYDGFWAPEGSAPDLIFANGFDP